MKTFPPVCGRRATHFEFSLCLAGATGAKSVVISNHTAGSVVLLSLALDGPAAGSFNISSDTGETNLPAGTLRTVELTYDPETIGNHGAALVVVTDADTHRLGLGLSGTGIDPSEELRIQALRISDDKVCIRFSSQRGYEYALLRGSNLCKHDHKPSRHSCVCFPSKQCEIQEIRRYGGKTMSLVQGRDVYQNTYFPARTT